MPIDIERIRLIRQGAEQLVNLDLDEVNLLFHAIGLPDVSWSSWYGGEDWDPTNSEKRRTITLQIQDLPSSELISLSTAASQVFAADAIYDRLEKGEPEPLEVFASHLTEQRAFVHEVASALAQWNIRLFVAHDDIDPDEQWHAAIEAGLQRADAGLVFLRPRFRESAWCDQEVGWLLGRGIPIRTLMFDHAAPYGPLGKQQAQEVHAATTAAVLTSSILDWLQSAPQLHQPFSSSLVGALSSSASFDRTSAVWARLSMTSELTEGQVAGIAAAIRDNDQVRGGEYRSSGASRGPWFPTVALPFLAQQPGYEANRDLVIQIAENLEIRELLPDFQGF